MNRIALVLGIIMLLVTFNAGVAAPESRQADDQKCDGTVYKAAEVSRVARITFKAEPTYTAEARAHKAGGRVLLNAVLCRSGEVTNIEVIERLSFGLTEKAIEAARKIKFKPAEKDGSAVSQTTQLQFRFSIDGPGPPGRRPLAKDPIEGRMVESVAVVGVTCQSRSAEIWRLIKTRSTSSYLKVRVERDLEALLALGYFDRKQSSLRIEEGENGLGVVFILKELPGISPCDN